MTDSRIAHEIVQAVEQVSADSRIAHEIVQVVELNSAETRIAHLVVQVVEGTLAIVGSGLYLVVPGKTSDTVYTETGTINLPIPNPFIKTAYIGS